MSNQQPNQTGNEHPESQAKQGATAVPGDNRSNEDMDGNRNGGASKSTGPTEPDSPADEDQSPQSR